MEYITLIESGEPQNKESNMNSITWRSLKGRFDKAPHALDVVREKA